MTISTNYNPSVLKTQRNLNSATNALNSALERMSTGFKVNCAADDAAGLYVATGLNTQIRGLNQAKKNVADGISLLNTGVGALDNMKNILTRLRDLSVQASNEVYDTTARGAMQKEADELTKQLYQIKNSTNFNGISMLGETEGSSSIRSITSDVVPAGYKALYTADDLDKIRNDLSGKYILMADIDLSSYANWDPIGNTYNPFIGVLDGNNYTIKNLKIDKRTQEGVGLFSTAVGATFKNIELENVNIKGKNIVGGLIAYTAMGTTISNTTVSGKISGGYWIGGLVGVSIGGNISNSKTNINVTATGYTAGGLAGMVTDKNKINNCSSEGNVSGVSSGGLVGENSSESSIVSSYSTCNIWGSSSGGLAGYNTVKSKIQNSYSTGLVSGPSSGGFIGCNLDSAEISNSYSTGSISGSATGGFAGKNSTNSSITNSFWDTQNSGTTLMAGINEQTDPTKSTVNGLTTPQMKDSNIFKNAGWSTTNWSFYSGYAPKASWENSIISVRLQVGANSDDDSNIYTDTSFKIGSLKIDLSTPGNSLHSVNIVDKVLEKLNKKVADFGAVLNRLNSVVQSQTTQIENLTSAISNIIDADIAEESAKYVKNQILQQTSSSLLSQSQSIHKNTILGLLS